MNTTTLGSFGFFTLGVLLATSKTVLKESASEHPSIDFTSYSTDSAQGFHDFSHDFDRLPRSLRDAISAIKEGQGNGDRPTIALDRWLRQDPHAAGQWLAASDPEVWSMLDFHQLSTNQLVMLLTAGNFGLDPALASRLLVALASSTAGQREFTRLIAEGKILASHETCLTAILSGESGGSRKWSGPEAVTVAGLLYPSLSGNEQREALGAWLIRASGSEEGLKAITAWKPPLLHTADIKILAELLAERRPCEGTLPTSLPGWCRREIVRFQKNKALPADGESARRWLASLPVSEWTSDLCYVPPTASNSAVNETLSWIGLLAAGQSSPQIAMRRNALIFSQGSFSLARGDVGTTLGLIAGTSGDPTLADGTQRLIRETLALDPVIVSQWIATLPPAAPGRDEAVALLSDAVPPSDPAAIEWALVIRDPDRRLAAITALLRKAPQLGTVVQERLLKLSDTDPARALIP